MASPKIDIAPVTARNLSKWLRQQLTHIKAHDDDETPPKFSRIVIRHIVKGNKTGEEVSSIDVPKKANDDWAEATGTELYALLQAEAAVLPGYQRYALYSYFSDDTDTHASRHLVGIQGPDDEEGFESEGTDSRGQVAQQMRHNEIAMKINAGQLMTVTSAQNQLITKLTGLVEDQIDKRVEMLETLEELARHKHEQEIAMLKEGARSEALRGIGKRVADMLIPAVANKLTGKSIYPIAGNPLLLMAKALMTNLAGNEERMGKIMSMLGPEEQIAFMNLYEELQKQPDDDADKKKAEDSIAIIE
jgi:hypothetical protein